MSLAIKLLILFVALLIAWLLKSLTEYVPCLDKDLERIKKLCCLKPGECFYDLGCGDGKTVFFLSKQCSVKAVGVERSKPLYLYCRLKKCFGKHDQTAFTCKNFNQVDFSKANVIFIYLLPRWTKELIPRLKCDLKPGTRIISYRFPIANMKPLEVCQPDDQGYKIYVYQI
ncbi:MAG: methionine biosynthesis protein MetW [Candidatus Uhrbacteria bacterium]